MQSDLGVALLLQVADDALTDEVAGSDDLQNLVVVFADESQLETVLGWVDSDGPRFGRSVEAVNGCSLYSREIDGLFKGLDDAVVAAHMIRTSVGILDGHAPTKDGNHVPVWQCIFDVVKSGIDEDTAVIPSSRFDPDGLVDENALTESFVGDGDGWSSGTS